MKNCEISITGFSIINTELKKRKRKKKRKKYINPRDKGKINSNHWKHLQNY